MKRILLSTAAFALLLSPLACDFEKTGNQLLAKKVMVGTLLSTPDVAFSPSAAAGIDAGTLPDGGSVIDDRITVPGQTAAFVFFGTREGDQGTPEPLANANVRIEVVNGSQFNLENEGAGTYSHTSDPGEDAGVKYQPGATYRFVAVENGTSHVGAVEQAPALERIERLHPAEGYVRHTANQAITLQRPAVSGERTHGFVTVVPLDSKGEKGQPTYTSVPKDPLGFIELVALPTAPSLAASITIPGTAFPQKDTNYLVIFQTMKTGGAESDNLFVGSALLVGTADVGLVHTQP
jgi:hypothetical protein